MDDKEIVPDTLYAAIATVIQQACQQVKQAVNQQMVQAYWHIGRLIVEQEQQGRKRAEYGNSASCPSACNMNSGKGLT